MASVKASLSLSTPRRMEFMDKRLSKNFHIRRHHKQVVHENLKLLRALEEIHSRSSTAGADNLAGGRGGVASGGDGGLGGASTAPVSLRRRKGVLSSSAGRSCSRKKLSSLLARKRNVKDALVARENQKMMEVSAAQPFFLHVRTRRHFSYNMRGYDSSRLMQRLAAAASLQTTQQCSVPQHHHPLRAPSIHTTG